VTVTALVLIAVTFVALLLWRRGERAAMVGWLWFLGTLVPTIGLVQVGMQAMADRYSYLPHVGLFVAIVWPAARWLKPRFALAIAAVAIASFAIITMVQLRHWKNSYTIYARALEVTDRNVMANVGLALQLTLDGRGDDAMPYYDQALDIDPYHAEAHNNFGNLLRQRKQYKEALRHLGAAVKINPKYAEARQNLANTLADVGRTDEAIRQFREAIRLDPDLSQAHYNLGVTLASVGRYDEAIDSLRHALRLRPGDPDAGFVYVLTLAEAGRPADARREFNRLLTGRLDDWPERIRQLAWLLATSPRQQTRDPQGAVELAELANKVTLSNQPLMLDTLAAAYASAGRFDRAVVAAERARDLAAARGPMQLVERIEHRLALYRSGRPFIASTQPTMQPATSPATIASPAPPAAGSAPAPPP
jgi:tetratricopeptide (TPR) repeat protein